MIKAHQLGRVHGGKRTNASVRLKEFQLAPGLYEIDGYRVWRTPGRTHGVRWLIDHGKRRVGQRGDLDSAERLVRDDQAARAV